MLVCGVSYALGGARGLSLKPLDAGYRLVDLLEQNFGVSRIKLALRDQRTHLLADANEVGKGVLALALRKLLARAVELGDEARPILLAREGVDVVGVGRVGQEGPRLGNLCLAIVGGLRPGWRRGHQHHYQREGDAYQ